MQENATIARPYAQAAYEYAGESGTLQNWSDFLAVLGCVVSDPTVRNLINDPRVGKTRVGEILLDLVAEYMPEGGKNFIKVLIDAGRLPLAGDISRIFEALRADAEGIADVEVVSAYPLDEEQESSLIDAVKRNVSKQVRVRTHVDNALIGGVILRVGDLVFDLSVRGRLNQLANQFS